MNIALKKSHNAPLAGQCSLLIIWSGSTWEGKEVSVNTPANISAERDTRKGSTRGATKEATGTVTYWVLLRWLFAVESAVIIIDGCISWLICVMILTKQHTAYRQHAYQLAACKWVWLFVWVYFVDYKLNNDVWSAFLKHLCCILFAVIKQSLCH